MLESETPAPSFKDSARDPQSQPLRHIIRQMIMTRSGSRCAAESSLARDGQRQQHFHATLLHPNLHHRARPARRKSEAQQMK